MTLGSITPTPSSRDLARGWLCGRQPPLAAPDAPRQAVRRALDDALRPALERPPCGVLFSGGRDSSVLLAAAVDLARREGHPAPIALTFRFAHPDTDESAWQRAVWTWVGRPEWSRLAMDDAFDVLGPVAQGELRRRGVWWPPLTHNAVPALELLRGGSLLDGEGGDEAWGIKRSAVVASMVHRRRPPGLRSVDHLLADLGPISLRRRAARLDLQKVPRDWLLPSAQAAFEDDLLRDALGAPAWWDEAVPATGRRIALRTAVVSFDATAAMRDVSRHHPFADPAVLGALGARGRSAGVARQDRGAARRRRRPAARRGPAADRQGHVPALGLRAARPSLRGRVGRRRAWTRGRAARRRRGARPGRPRCPCARRLRAGAGRVAGVAGRAGAGPRPPDRRRAARGPRGSGRSARPGRRGPAGHRRLGRRAPSGTTARARSVRDRGRRRCCSSASRSVCGSCASPG